MTKIKKHGILYIQIVRGGENMYRYKGGNVHLDKVFTQNKVYNAVNNKGKLVHLVCDLKNTNIWVMCDEYFEKV